MTAVVSFAVLLLAPGKSWAPVEYVKICSLYGAGFHYHPGTDVCWNPDTEDARQQTEDGTWRWRMPPNPLQWVRAPKKACKGKLVPVTVASASTLTENTRGRYETAPLPLVLEPDQYISAVIYQGGPFVRTGPFE